MSVVVRTALSKGHYLTKAGLRQCRSGLSVVADSLLEEQVTSFFTRDERT